MNITISNDKLVASINTKGAELNSLKKDEREYIWEGNPDFWGKHSPILFPIVGTLKDNQYTYDDSQYNLSRHGFARDCEFEIIKSSKESVIFSLKYTEKTLKVYPFKFELQVIYALQDLKLEVSYKVINLNSSKLPFSIGGHPAFALPENFENYSLLFNNDETITSFFLENDLLSDNFQTIDLENHELKLKYPLFENDALIIKSLKSKTIEVLENKKPLFKFEFIDFPNFGIWTKQNAPFICLEPWFGYSDVLNSNGMLLNKEGIIVLEENKSFQASFSVSIY